jgi:4-amino-4-deoxy-L-arabinose transferase-like glycosyltransferase
MFYGMRKEIIYLTQIFLLALFIRLIFVLAVPQLEVTADAAGYDRLGLNLSLGHGFSMDKEEPYRPSVTRGPIYPLFLSLIYILFGHNFLAVRIAQAIISAFSCLLIYWIGKHTFNERVGIISSLISSLWIGLIAYTGYILTETLFTFWLLLTVLFFIKAVKERSTPFYLLTGVSLGITTLTRPTSLAFPLFVPLVLIPIYQNKKKALVHSLLLLTAMLIILIPWTIRNYMHFRTVIPTHLHLGNVLWGGKFSVYTYDDRLRGDSREQEKVIQKMKKLTEGLSPIEADKKLFKEGVKDIIQDPGLYFKAFIKKVILLWRDPIGKHVLKWRGYSLASNILVILYYLFLGLSVIGIVISIRQWRSTLPILSIILYFTLIYGLLHAIPRYHLPIIPYVLVFAANGSLKIMDLLKRRSSL